MRRRVLKNTAGLKHSWNESDLSQMQSFHWCLFCNLRRPHKPWVADVKLFVNFLKQAIHEAIIFIGQALPHKIWVYHNNCFMLTWQQLH